MLKRIGFRGLLVGLLVGLCVGGTFAWASIPNSKSGQVTGCYTTGATTKTLRVIDFEAGERCKATETYVSLQARGVRFTGAWSASTVYSINDLVLNGGSSFIRIKTSAFTGIPTSNATFWTQLSGASSCGGFPHAGIDWSKPGSTAGNGCDLTGANLSNANLTNANLTNVNLTNANLSNAHLDGANLTGANLTNAALLQASSPTAAFTNANLTNAIFVAANVTGADMTGANLTGANFALATGTDSLVYSNTTCPDGSNSDGNGGTCAGFGGSL